MNDRPAESSAAAPAAAPSIALPVDVRLRHRSWEAYSVVVATIVGLLSLAVSAYTAYTLHLQTRAQVFPYLQLVQEPAKRTVAAFNKGTGPAFVRSIVVRFDGRPVKTWRQFFKAAGFAPGGGVLSSTASAAAIAANETYPLLVFADEKDFEAYRGLDPRRYDAAICYCSVLDECWTLKLGVDAPPAPQPERGACRVDPATAFEE